MNLAKNTSVLATWLVPSRPHAHGKKSEHGVVMSPRAPTSPRTPRAVWDYTKTAGDESVCLLKTYYLYGGLGLP